MYLEENKFCCYYYYHYKFVICVTNCFINFLHAITGDKLTILSTLINQLLSYASLRDVIDEAMDSYKSLSYELKQIQWAEQRRDREEAQLKHKKRLEQKIQQQQAQAAQLQQQKYVCVCVNMRVESFPQCIVLEFPGVLSQ